MNKQSTDWKDQPSAPCNNRCLDAMSLVNTFTVLVTDYKKGKLTQDDLYEKVMSLHKECDNYGFVHDK
jgi:hypothetical protein